MCQSQDHPSSDKDAEVLTCPKKDFFHVLAASSESYPGIGTKAQGLKGIQVPVSLVGSPVGTDPGLLAISTIYYRLSKRPNSVSGRLSTEDQPQMGTQTRFASMSHAFHPNLGKHSLNI